MRVSLCPLSCAAKSLSTSPTKGFPPREQLSIRAGGCKEDTERVAVNSLVLRALQQNRVRMESPTSRQNQEARPRGVQSAPQSVTLQGGVQSALSIGVYVCGCVCVI